MYGIDWEGNNVAEATSNEAKFKVGDRVVTEIGDDDIGIVRGYRDSRYAVQFQSQRCDVSNDFIWRDSQLFPVSPKFKIGDRVSVVDGGYGDKVFQITDVDDDMEIVSYWVLPHGYCFNEDRLELAPDCAERKVEQDNEVTLGDILAEALAAKTKPQPKFKVGDVVTYRGGSTVRRTIAGVRDDIVDRVAYRYTNGGWDYESSLVLAPTLTPHIVARVRDGKPLPSLCPHVHASVEDATAEAERLARNNPGQEFAVYQRVAGRVAEVRVNMKEVA